MLECARTVAVKLFDAETFSDGTALSEWAANRVASQPGHPALVQVLGTFEDPRGMVLELLPNAKAAASPPSFATVTRDALPRHGAPGVLYAPKAARQIAAQVSAAAEYLHSKGAKKVSCVAYFSVRRFGDIYLHNTLVIRDADATSTSVSDVRLSDFGACAAVDLPELRRLEVRSFGWLLQDLLECHAEPQNPEDAKILELLKELRASCGAEDPNQLPSFKELREKLVDEQFAESCSKIAEVACPLHFSVGYLGMADAKLDGWLNKVEEAVLSHQTARLQRWAERQRQALQRAVKVEQAVCANNSSITDGVITGVQEELRQRDAERQRMRQHTKDMKDESDQHFQRELRRMRRGQKAMAKELLEKQSMRLADAYDEIIALKWQSLEEVFQRKLWQHYTEAHRRGYGRSAASTPEDLREVWQNGELKSLLAVEKQGWGRSQRADLQHLENELDGSLGKSIEALEAKLTTVADLEPECLQQIRSMAEDAKKELEKITAEIGGSLPELEAAWKACETDYEQKASELQQLQAAVARKRFEDMETFRLLKLQLCQWKLSYQSAFHDTDVEPSTSSLDPKEVEQRFANARRLARKLWAQMPVNEAHRFLAQVAQMLAKSEPSAATALMKVYEKELKRLGALPLVSHARSPELLQCPVVAPITPSSSASRGPLWKSVAEDLCLTDKASVGAVLLLRRLTLVCSDLAHVATANKASALRPAYHLVALRPTNDETFRAACEKGMCDIISLQLDDKLAFSLRGKDITAFTSRGGCFEIELGPAIRDAGGRKQMLNNVEILLHATRGRHVILTSGALDPIEMRSPQDIANFAGVIGVKGGFQCVSEAPYRALHRNLLRRGSCQVISAADEEMPQADEKMRVQ
eukprot:s829_g4.t1